jgi:hypothetical protein
MYNGARRPTGAPERRDHEQTQKAAHTSQVAQPEHVCRILAGNVEERGFVEVGSQGVAATLARGVNTYVAEPDALRLEICAKALVDLVHHLQPREPASHSVAAGAQCWAHACRGSCSAHELIAAQHMHSMHTQCSRQAQPRHLRLQRRTAGQSSSSVSLAPIKSTRLEPSGRNMQCAWSAMCTSRKCGTHRFCASM